MTADDTITEGEKTITLTIPNARFEVDENSADGKKYKLPADGKLTATIKITVAPKSGTGEGDVTTVAATAAGTVKGTPTADQTTGSIDSENNKITITLTGDYKFSTTEVGAVTASSLIKTPTDTGLTFAAALKANDTTAQTLEITVSGTPANEITDNIVIDDTALKGLIVTSTDAALTTETVKTTSTAKFAITSTGGGNEDADKVSAVEITEPTGDQTVNLNDITGDKNKITFKAKLQNSASTPADITEAGKTIKWSVAKADGDNGDIKTTAFTDIETTTVDDGIATATLTIDEATTAKALVVTAAYEGADAVTDGATPATRNITIVTKAIEAELGTVASLLTDLSVSDVDSSAQDIKTEIANKVKTAIEEKIADNTALKDIWTVKSVEVTTSEPITLEQGKENDVSITVVFQKGGADISATDTNSENKTIKVTPKTTTP